MNTQDLQFEQNQKLTNLLEEMRRQEYVSIDPIYKSNLRNELTKASTTLESPNVVEVSPNQISEFFTNLKAKFKFTIIAAPILLGLLFGVMVLKNLYQVEVPQDNEATKSAEESQLAPPQPDTFATMKAPAPEAPAQESNILENSAQRATFDGLTENEIQLFKTQILSRLAQYPHPIAEISFTKPSPASYQMILVLENGESFRVLFALEGEKLKAIFGERISDGKAK